MDCIRQIHNYLYLGSVFATHPAVIKSHHIAHIVSLGPKSCQPINSMLHFDVEDTETESAKMKREVFPQTYTFIANAIEQKQNVLVHCSAGKSRSATVVIYYLMVRFRLRFDDVLTYVLTQKPDIRLNNGFFNLLKDADNQLLLESYFYV